MKRRNLIKYLSVLPLTGAVIGSESSFKPLMAAEPEFPAPQLGNNQPKRIAAILTEYRPGSHADVIIGKYLEGFNQDQMAPYPESKIVSMFTEQVPENDMSRPLAKKYNIPIFRTVADALTMGGDGLAVDAVLLIGEHGVYPMNDKEQKQYPRFEMFLKMVLILNWQSCNYRGISACKSTILMSKLI